MGAGVGIRKKMACGYYIGISGSRAISQITTIQVMMFVTKNIQNMLLVDIIFLTILHFQIISAELLIELV